MAAIFAHFSTRLVSDGPEKAQCNFQGFLYLIWVIYRISRLFCFDFFTLFYRSKNLQFTTLCLFNSTQKRARVCIFLCVSHGSNSSALPACTSLVVNWMLSTPFLAKQVYSSRSESRMCDILSSVLPLTTATLELSLIAALPLNQRISGGGFPTA